jgi:S1-C subfamily serine protease
MNLMKKRSSFLLTVLVANAFFFTAGCQSVKQPDPETIYKQPDYTLDDVRKAEITRINEMMKTDSIQALWRAHLLQDSETVSQCMDAVADEYGAAVQKKDYFTALRLYDSLRNSGFNDISKLEMGADELKKLSVENVPGLDSSPVADTAADAVPEKVSTYVKGTVTVWVDRGIQVKNGVGYPDIVIGSGFFIDKAGYIVTNYHVIKDLVDPKYEGYARLFVKLADDPDTRIPSKVIGWDPVLDLALLKTEVDAPYVFNLGASRGLDVGDKIYVIGSPVGLGRTLTSGVVSALDRKLFTTGSVMQIDAAVNSGNSGGPCIDSQGNVQAVVFAGMLKYEGLNFAIPVEYLKDDLPTLYHGGKRAHPWIAAYGHTKKNGTEEAGLEVQYVMPGGSADRAGLEPGDIIISINGKKIHNLEDMQNELRRNVPDTIIRVTYTANAGDDSEGLLYLSERPENPGYEIYQNDVVAGSFVPLLGMKLTAVSTAYRNRYSISDIIKGSIADESGFSVNDPVAVLKVKFSDDNSIMYTELSLKRRKQGYLDANIGLSTQLDSPYYF